MSTDIYGRSVLENSSFIVSSAYPDERLHGRGFYARLSGATIEALNILAIMFIGHNPYSYSNNELFIKLKPNIPGWLFDENNEIEFLLHGYTQITYVNNSRFDTHKLQIQKIIKYNITLAKQSFYLPRRYVVALIFRSQLNLTLYPLVRYHMTPLKAYLFLLLILY